MAENKDNSIKDSKESIKEVKEVIHFVGVDDGHYATKVIADDGKMFQFPSRARQGMHVIALSGDQEYGIYDITDSNNQYTVHPDIANPEETRFDGYPSSDLNLVLVHNALALSGFGGKKVTIATGLPVENFYNLDGTPNQKLLETKTKNLSREVTCGKLPMATITKNYVTTEAIAAYFDLLMDMDGKKSADYDELTSSKLAVIDIGGKTTDCAVLLTGGKAVDRNRFTSVQMGVLNLHDEVKSLIQKDFGFNSLTLELLEMAVRSGEFKYRGEVHDISSSIDTLKERLMKDIFLSLDKKLGDAGDLDKIVFVGGGSIGLKDLLAKKYPKQAVFPEHPEFANARGMYKIARYVRR